MIRSNFQIAFKLRILHSYFEQNICNCLQFSPGTITRNLLKRFAFKCNNKINGFDFYINTTESLPAFFNYLSNTTNQSSFDFKILTTNSAFSFFTDLPVDRNGQLIYDTHAASNIYKEGIVYLDEYFSENESAPDFGSLIIHFDDILKFRADKGYTQFGISFEARSTQWQYYVINKTSIQLDNPAIGKTDINFTGPQNVVLGNGEQAILFSSGDHLIPLSEIPKYKFDLVNTPATNDRIQIKNKSASKLIYKGLPNPNPERIGITKVNGQNQVSSPIYIYV